MWPDTSCHYTPHVPLYIIKYSQQVQYSLYNIVIGVYFMIILSMLRRGCYSSSSAHQLAIQVKSSLFIQQVSKQQQLTQSTTQETIATYRPQYIYKAIGASTLHVGTCFACMCLWQHSNHFHAVLHFCRYPFSTHKMLRYSTLI